MTFRACIKVYLLSPTVILFDPSAACSKMSTTTMTKATSRSKALESCIISLVGDPTVVSGATNSTKTPLLTGVQCQGPTIGLSLAYRTDSQSAPTETTIESWANTATEWAHKNQLLGDSSRANEIGHAVTSALTGLSAYANATSDEFPRCITTRGGATVSCKPPVCGAEDTQTYGVLIDVEPAAEQPPSDNAGKTRSRKTATFILRDDSDSEDDEGEPGADGFLDQEVGNFGPPLRRSTAGSDNLSDLC